MAYFEVTLRSETSIAIRDIFAYFEQEETEAPHFHLAFYLEEATVLFYSSNVTFSIPDAFTRVSWDAEPDLSISYTLSSGELEKLEQILDSSPTYPLILSAYALKINFKREIEHIEHKEQFFTFLSVDFPIIEVHEFRLREELFKYLLSIEKCDIDNPNGDFNDISTLASVKEQTLLLFPTRFQEAEQLFRILELDRNIVFSIQISDYVDFNELRPEIKAKTSNLHSFIHPSKIAGSIRAAWATDGRDCWLLNKVQMHTTRVFEQIPLDKKVVPKALYSIEKTIEGASFAAISFCIGRNTAIQELSRIENGSTLGLAFEPDIGDLKAKFADIEALKFVAPGGVLFVQKKFANCTGILRLGGVRTEICYLCPTEIAESSVDIVHGLISNENSPQMQHLELTPEYINSDVENLQEHSLPVDAHFQEDQILERAHFSEFKSQELRFAMKFSAGQNVEFPIYTRSSPKENSALNLSGLKATQDNISSIPRLEEGNSADTNASSGRTDSVNDQDILSLLNEDSGVEW